MRRSAQAKEIFLHALELESGAARQDYLDQSCGKDSDLRRRVAALLDAHDHPESYLDRPAATFRCDESLH